MAKMFYANDGSIDLKPKTMEALKNLPKSWDVILNFRPVNGETAREIDALILTEHAIHVIEFKYREKPVHIRSDGQWIAGNYEMRNSVRGGESPAQQVENSTKAFQKILTGKFSKFDHSVFAWVVLEKYNHQNRQGGQPMSTKGWTDVGWVKVINGVEYLKEIISKREKDKPKILTDTDQELFRKYFGVKPLGQLTIQGFVKLLDTQQELSYSEIKVTSAHSRITFLATTDGNGSFELQGLPLEPVEIEIPNSSNLRILPNVKFQAHTTYLQAHIFLVNPQISEERVQELLEKEMTCVNHDIDAILELANSSEEKIAKLEKELAYNRQALESYINSQTQEDNEFLLNDINSRLERIEQLQSQKRTIEAVSFLPADVIRQDALEPLKSELQALNLRVSEIEQQVHTLSGQVTEVAEKSDEARQYARQSAQEAAQAKIHAKDAEFEAKRAANEAEKSTKVQEKTLEHTVSVYKTSEERKRIRAEAMKLSAIVGAAGSILSMQPLPFADNVILAPMQIWLVISIGKLYGQSITQDAALKLLGTLGFGFAAQHATVALYRLIPGLSFGLGPFTVFGFTLLLGAMTTVFYERGQMPDKKEQKALLNSVKELMKDKEFVESIKLIGTTAAQEVKQRGYKTRTEDMQDILNLLSERTRPLGERIEKTIFINKDNE